MGAEARGDFDILMARLDPPMVVVTATDGRERGGCLVGFHAQSSMEPGRYVVWLSKANHTYRVALHGQHLAVHFLDRADLELAEVFGTLSGDDVDKFERVEWDPGPGGVPLLRRCPNRMVLRRVALLDEGGDHVCMVGESLQAEHRDPFTPLRLSDVTHLPPGHEHEERPRPSTERES